VERILSKDEIAELLSAVREGDITVEADTAEPHKEAPVKKLDLIFSHGSRHCKFDNLDIILDSFARNYGISLTNCLQRSTTVKRIGMETYEFENFLQRMNGQDAIGIIRLDPLRWGGMFLMNSGLSFFLVEKLLGGHAEAKLIVPKRPLTTIERHILKDVFKDACADLEKAFSPLEKLDSALVKIESNPRLVNIVPPDTLVIVCRFAVTLRNLNSEISLVLPLPSLEPLREKMRDQIAPLSKKADIAWRTHVASSITEMEAEVSARLAEIALPVRDILNFEVGDIIELGRDPSAPLALLVEGKYKFVIQAGVVKGKKAVRLMGRAEDSQPESKNK
jgi:flagellar motor switch protein FliM